MSLVCEKEHLHLEEILKIVYVNDPHEASTLMGSSFESSFSFCRMPLRKGFLSNFYRATFITMNVKTLVISVQSRWNAFFPKRFDI